MEDRAYLLQSKFQTSRQIFRAKNKGRPLTLREERALDFAFREGVRSALETLAVSKRISPKIVNKALPPTSASTKKTAARHSNGLHPSSGD